MTAAAVASIDAQLDAVCREHEVAITLAIESGRRAWWLEAIFDQEAKGPYLVPKRGISPCSRVALRSSSLD